MSNSSDSKPHTGSPGAADRLPPVPRPRAPRPAQRWSVPPAETSPPTAPAPEAPKPPRPRRRLTRERFNAIYLAARDVDADSLAQLATPPPEEAVELEEPALIETLTRHRRGVSSFLVSVTFHLALLLLLALMVVPWQVALPTISLEASLTPAELPQRDPQEAIDLQTLQIDLPDVTQSPEEMKFADTAVDTQLTVADAQTELPQPQTEVVAPQPEMPVVAAPLPTRAAGGGLTGRDEATRGKLAASRGGSTASEAAVERGLAWIIQHQRSDGSWRFRHDDGRCRGECANEGMIESTTAATGLALMSLLGAGYTHQHGPYQKEVEAGLRFLIDAMRKTRHGGSLAKGERGMYSHAIATIAISEAFAMTQDSWLFHPADSARQYIVNAQHRKGGWRYVPGEAGDMTVTGWQLMALKSAQMCRIPTEPEVWQRAESFIDSLHTTDGWYGYQKPSEHPTTTAVGVLMKMYLGASRENADVNHGADYVAGTGPSPTDMYFNYYATQVLHHLGGPNWKQWNPKMRDYLIETQDQSGTHRAGSWYFIDPHGAYGGRLYTTAMAVMTLEVYYRYLPLYDDQRLGVDPTLDGPLDPAGQGDDR